MLADLLKIAPLLVGMLGAREAMEFIQFNSGAGRTPEPVL